MLKTLYITMSKCQNIIALQYFVLLTLFCVVLFLFYPVLFLTANELVSLKCNCGNPNNSTISHASPKKKKNK